MRELRVSAHRSRFASLVAIVFVVALVGCERCSAQSTATAPSSTTPQSSSALPAPSADPLASIRWDDTPIDWTRPLPVTPPGGLAEAGYVGSAACKSCHASLYASYARHSMARTGLRPLASLDQKWLAEIFDAGAKEPRRHDRSGYSYRPFRDGNKYFIEELVVDADGKRVASWMQPITHTLSAGRYGVAFYFRQGTHTYQTPLDYYPAAAKFEMDPGAIDGNFRFSKSLETFCISCHADYPLRRAGTENVFVDPIAAGVGCERCHGPGERHVKTLARADIVNPTRLSTARQLDVCSQCHESNESSLRADRHDFSYRPGEPLDAYRVNFLGAPPETDRVGLLAHSERMVESACWRGSGGKLVCTSCHDAHKSSFDQPAEWWDKKCNACHEEKRCSADAATRATEKNHCVTCHMRKGPPENPRLVTITDHLIARKPPPIRAGIGEPQKLVAWGAFIGEASSGDDFGAIEALAYAHVGKADETVRLAPGLVERRPHVPKLYDFLAGRFQQRRDLASVARAHAAVLRFNPDARGALFGYARAMLDLPGPEAAAQAMHALDRMIALDPDDGSALETKAIVFVRSGKMEDARPLFEHAAAMGTTTAASHVALAVFALREGRHADAVSELELARRIEPSDSWILEKLGAAYANANDRAHVDEIDRAKKHYAESAKSPTAATWWLPPAWR